MQPVKLLFGLNGFYFYFFKCNLRTVNYLDIYLFILLIHISFYKKINSEALLLPSVHLNCNLLCRILRGNDHYQKDCLAVSWVFESDCKNHRSAR